MEWKFNSCQTQRLSLRPETQFHSPLALFPRGEIKSATFPIFNKKEHRVHVTTACIVNFAVSHFYPSTTLKPQKKRIKHLILRVFKFIPYLRARFQNAWTRANCLKHFLKIQKVSEPTIATGQGSFWHTEHLATPTAIFASSHPRRWTLTIWNAFQC